MILQLLDGRHDECQWRADVVSGIDKELHLVLVELLAQITTPYPPYQTNEAQQYRDINNVRE